MPVEYKIDINLYFIMGRVVNLCYEEGGVYLTIMLRESTLNRLIRVDVIINNPSEHYIRHLFADDFFTDSSQIVVILGGLDLLIEENRLHANETNLIFLKSTTSAPDFMWTNIIIDTTQNSDIVSLFC